MVGGSNSSLLVHQLCPLVVFARGQSLAVKASSPQKRASTAPAEADPASTPQHASTAPAEALVAPSPQKNTFDSQPAHPGPSSVGHAPATPRTPAPSHDDEHNDDDDAEFAPACLPRPVPSPAAIAQRIRRADGRIPLPESSQEQRLDIKGGGRQALSATSTLTGCYVQH